MANSIEDFDLGDNVDVSTFEQILEMDDPEEDDTREFSRSLVFGFLTQAEETLSNLDEGIRSRDLEKLSQLGHFLKGSSATLGFVKIRDQCEKIQHWGHMKDETGDNPLDDEERCLSLIDGAVRQLKGDLVTLNGLMEKFYRDSDK